MLPPNKSLQICFFTLKSQDLPESIFLVGFFHEIEQGKSNLHTSLLILHANKTHYSSLAEIFVFAISSLNWRETKKIKVARPVAI